MKVATGSSLQNCQRCHNCRNTLQCFHTWCCSTQDGQVWFPMGCGFPPGWDFSFGKPRTARPELLPSNMDLRVGKTGRIFSSTEAIPSSVDIDKFYRYVGLDEPQSPRKPESKKKNPEKESSVKWLWKIEVRFWRLHERASLQIPFD